MPEVIDRSLGDGSLPNFQMVKSPRPTGRSASQALDPEDVTPPDHEQEGQQKGSEVEERRPAINSQVAASNVVRDRSGCVNLACRLPVLEAQG